MQIKRNKSSWLPAEGLIDSSQNRFSVSNEKFGLRLFLTVVSSLFLLLIISYKIRMGLADWHSLPQLTLLWINTAILGISCIGFQRAKLAASQNQLDKVKFNLLFGGLLTCVFLIGQVMVWKQLSTMGFYLENNPANSFFYLITGLHGLHLIGGLIAWSNTSIQLFCNNHHSNLSSSVELLTIYWHFLLAVWLILFTIIVMT